MQSTTEKMKNIASAAKEKVDIYKAKVDEKVYTHVIFSSISSSAFLYAIN